MRLKSIALGLLISAAGSLIATPAVADWSADTMVMEATKQNPMSGKSDFIYVDGLQGMFAVRFDYEKWSALKGNPFSGIAYINCISGAYKYYWDQYGFDEKTQQEITQAFTNVFCKDYKKFYPDSPALKSKALKGKSF
tara:strand:+ start:498 stop:911 length:414 start_codon:yes stop_codon:yes gene_type:complete